MYHEPMPPERVLARRRAIGQHIRTARLKAKLTQEQTALRAGIGIDSYNRIELGHASPLLDNLIRIADAIGVPLAEFVRD